jgi:chaperonin GroES
MSKKTITVGLPQEDRVIIYPDSPDEMSAHGIYLPDQAQTYLYTGVIIAAGLGRIVNGFWVPVTLKEGDRVMYSKHAGAEIRLSGVDLIIMRAGDVLIELTPAEIEVEVPEPVVVEKFKLEHVNV